MRKTKETVGNAVLEVKKEVVCVKMALTQESVVMAL